jgi:hypothetical protein
MCASGQPEGKQQVEFSTPRLDLAEIRGNQRFGTVDALPIAKVFGLSFP